MGKMKTKLNVLAREFSAVELFSDSLASLFSKVGKNSIYILIEDEKLYRLVCNSSRMDCAIKINKDIKMLHQNFAQHFALLTAHNFFIPENGQAISSDSESA